MSSVVGVARNDNRARRSRWGVCLAAALGLASSFAVPDGADAQVIIQGPDHRGRRGRVVVSAPPPPRVRVAAPPVPRGRVVVAPPGPPRGRVVVGAPPPSRVVVRPPGPPGVYIGAPGPRIVARVAPPPPRVYHRPPAPYGGAVWVNGFWHWDGYQHVWMEGHWEQPRQGYMWVDARWENQGGEWVFVPGYWATPN